jgi:hypothetical membrane protein
LNRHTAYLAGLIIPIWLLIGVTFVGSLYPGYSHVEQALGVLGAHQAPTQMISPIVTNYPLGLLFLLFGLAVFKTFRGSKWAEASAGLIMLHGAASLVVGFFTCDVDCSTQTPSLGQTIHNYGRLVMLVTLLLATLVWVFLAKGLLGRKRFALFSLLCTLGTLGTLALMGHALASGHGFGLYQRLNYGVSAIWVGSLAWVLLRRRRVRMSDHVSPPSTWVRPDPDDGVEPFWSEPAESAPSPTSIGNHRGKIEAATSNLGITARRDR